MSDTYEFEAGWGMEDIAYEFELEQQRRYEQYLENVRNGIWSTRDGQKLHISQMTTSHLINSYNKIVRENWRIEYLPLIEQELEKRNNMTPKTYVLKYSDNVEFLTDDELLNFIKGAVIHNRDIKKFEIIEIPK